MKANKCMDCPHKQTGFMNRTCELTGNTIPLFSAPVDCPQEGDNNKEVRSLWMLVSDLRGTRD